MSSDEGGRDVPAASLVRCALLRVQRDGWSVVEAVRPECGREETR
jgi:hypothetical protein